MLANNAQYNEAFNLLAVLMRMSIVPDGLPIR